MSKILKAIVAITVVTGGGLFVLNWMSPMISIDSNDPQQVYGSTINLRTTIKNVSPLSKNIYFDDKADITILVDGASSPVSVTPKEKATSTITLAPFSSQTYVHIVTLTRSQDDIKTPQIVDPDTTELAVSPGQHTVKAEWAGNVSGEYTFGVR
jgi:hypothetical protein